MTTTALILLAAFGVLAWGFGRARPYGRIGILAWLQSVVLMTPWLLFFGLFAAGIYLNLVWVLALVLVSAGLYIYLGRLLRASGQDELATKRAEALAAKAMESSTETPSADPSALENEPSSAGVEAEPTESLKTDPPDAEAAVPAPIPAEDLAAIEGIFGIDTFFRTETIPYDQGAIFKGNLRGQPAETAEKLNQLLAERLDERYHLFLIEGPEGKPVAVGLPSTADPQPTTLGQKILAGVLAIATFATCLETAGIIQEFDFFRQPQRWPEALPFALGLAAVLVVHEVGHRLVAERYDIRISPPFFLPAWQLGSFGGLMRFESLLPNRSVLFDIAFAGPAAGGLLSLLFLLVGLVISHPGSYFQLPAAYFQSSILVGALARVVLGDALQQAVVDVHPLTLVGWLGLAITALNVMPAGQLDGGRIVQAIYGRKTTGRATTITLIGLALVSLVNPLALYWAILILFLQRRLERPCLDDLSEPDDARAALGLLILFLMLVTLLPLTPSLAGRLGIGAT
ncbi:site-2 protease family protein [Romeria aff. gracilis LEGE 07310]|uniref:Site-2 protease family protein n=1 Tax=Vasconcelosia minhoensis LEGE 07310 TaxID=915328 RepID=A0A8J7AX89_9CYAN|nr:site-2 protease family protein [Romeria gracilis]MBE9079113.1 site-2 protease family protein [Romeria aff. gracilis LEGE 07310]